jgi:Meckel syndrome type 1 protein
MLIGAALAGRAAAADQWAAIAAYERALRAPPDSPDAPGVHLSLGRTWLARGRAPEAGVAFAQMARRYPTSPLLPEARLGEAAALRLRRRFDQARRVLAEVRAEAAGDLRCAVLREAASLERTAGAAPAAGAAARAAVRACPALGADPACLHEVAEALALAGGRDAARALLAAPRPPCSPDQEARLKLLAGGLAPDAVGARAEYEQALALAPAPALAATAEMRLALLAADAAPARAARTLVALAARPLPAALRASTLCEAAALRARLGRHEEALALLARAAAVNPAAGAATDARRADVLGRWLRDLAAADDAAGVATVYAAYVTDFAALAGPEERALVARALGALGLNDAATRLLEPGAARAASGVPVAALATRGAVRGGDGR